MLMKIHHSQEFMLFSHPPEPLAVHLDFKINFQQEESKSLVCILWKKAYELQWIWMTWAAYSIVFYASSLQPFFCFTDDQFCIYLFIFNCSMFLWVPLPTCLAEVWLMGMSQIWLTDHGMTQQCKNTGNYKIAGKYFRNLSYLIYKLVMLSGLSLFGIKLIAKFTWNEWWGISSHASLFCFV